MVQPGQYSENISINSKSTNSFNNFEGRKYDYDSLEKETIRLG